MSGFSSIAELVSLAETQAIALSEVVWRQECERSGWPPEAVWREMASRLAVMQQAAAEGIGRREKSISGLTGGDAWRLAAGGFLGPVVSEAAAKAVAVSEVNAGMGRIVACPTAGSCGIVPGALLAVGSSLGCGEDKLVRALFTAAGIGEVIAANATVAGAVGGCQAECGSAAAMAAAAVELLGGAPRQSAAAAALALKNLLGLACDPVAGLVEVPCVKRNGFAAVHALLAAQMALAGVTSVIPADEVVAAMRDIGDRMPCSLKETSEAGLAQTPTAVAIQTRLTEGK